MLATGYRTKKWISYNTAGIFRCQICKSFLVSLLLLTLFASSIPAAEIIGSESDASDSQSQPTEESIKGKSTFKVKVDLVTANVRVIGQAFSELRTEDFIIYDNDIPHEVAFLSHDELPIAVVLVIVQSNFASLHLPDLQIAAFLSLKNLKPEDQVALFAVRSSTNIGMVPSHLEKLSDFTMDRLFIAEKISNIKAPERSHTNIFNALYYAARYIRDEIPDRRCAVIFISDYITFGHLEDIDVAQTEIMKSGACLFGIQTPLPELVIAPHTTPMLPFGVSLPQSGLKNERDINLKTQEHAAQSYSQLKEMADLTGGAMLKVDSSTSLQKAFEIAINNFRYQYTLGFYPSDPGEKGSYHELEVKLSKQDHCPRCSVETRKGYYTGIQPPISQNVKVPPTPKAVVDRTDEILTQQSILTAGTHEWGIADIPFTVKTSEQFQLNGQPQFNVYLNIDPQKIEFKKMDDRYSYNLQIAVFYADKKGKILGNDWRGLKKELNEEAYNQVLQEGILYKTTIPIKAKKQNYKVVVYDEVSNNLGSSLVKQFE
jgi:VWFA-related protein